MKNYYYYYIVDSDVFLLLNVLIIYRKTNNIYFSFLRYSGSVLFVWVHWKEPEMFVVYLWSIRASLLKRSAWTNGDIFVSISVIVYFSSQKLISFPKRCLDLEN